MSRKQILQASREPAGQFGSWDVLSFLDEVCLEQVWPDVGGFPITAEQFRSTSRVPTRYRCGIYFGKNARAQGAPN